MKRLILGLSIAACLLAPAAVRAEEKKTGSETGGHGELKAWEWANFLLLAGGLAYIIGKNAGPAFDARGRKIRKDMVEAEEAKREADARVDAVEQRLAHLGDEITALRAEAQREEEAEHARYERHTASEITKIQAHAEQDIASAAKAAKMDLKRYAAEIALRLAEEKIRTRMTPETEDRLVRGFVKNLEAPPTSERAS